MPFLCISSIINCSQNIVCHTLDDLECLDQKKEQEISCCQIVPDSHLKAIPQCEKHINKLTHENRDSCNPDIYLNKQELTTRYSEMMKNHFGQIEYLKDMLRTLNKANLVENSSLDTSSTSFVDDSDILNDDYYSMSVYPNQETQKFVAIKTLPKKSSAIELLCKQLYSHIIKTEITKRNLNLLYIFMHDCKGTKMYKSAFDGKNGSGYACQATFDACFNDVNIGDNALNMGSSPCDDISNNRICLQIALSLVSPIDKAKLAQKCQNDYHVVRIEFKKVITQNKGNDLEDYSDQLQKLFEPVYQICKESELWKEFKMACVATLSVCVKYDSRSCVSLQDDCKEAGSFEGFKVQHEKMLKNEKEDDLDLYRHLFVDCNEKFYNIQRHLGYYDQQGEQALQVSCKTFYDSCDLNDIVKLIGKLCLKQIQDCANGLEACQHISQACVPDFFAMMSKDSEELLLILQKARFGNREPQMKKPDPMKLNSTDPEMMKLAIEEFMLKNERDDAMSVSTASTASRSSMESFDGSNSHKRNSSDMTFNTDQIWDLEKLPISDSMVGDIWNSSLYTKALDKRSKTLFMGKPAQKAKQSIIAWKKMHDKLEYGGGKFEEHQNLEPVKGKRLQGKQKLMIKRHVIRVSPKNMKFQRPQSQRSSIVNNKVLKFKNLPNLGTDIKNPNERRRSSSMSNSGGGLLPSPMSNSNKRSEKLGLSLSSLKSSPNASLRPNSPREKLGRLSPRGTRGMANRDFTFNACQQEYNDLIKCKQGRSQIINNVIHVQKMTMKIAPTMQEVNNFQSSCQKTKLFQVILKQHATQCLKAIAQCAHQNQDCKKLIDISVCPDLDVFNKQIHE